MWMFYRTVMGQTWVALVTAFDRFFPEGSPRRKALHITAIILLVEGLSVFALFSHVGLPVGLASVLAGTFILLLLRPKDPRRAERSATFGVRLVDAIERFVGGGIPMMAMGSAIIVIVLVYNFRVSPRPELGDADILTVLFGAIVFAHPIVSPQFRVESSFALIFIGLVMLALVVPQVVLTGTGTGGESAFGNWYVHYMLAAPFAGSLDIIGIPASSVADIVTIQLNDGSIHTLRISAYCAGLYSFSIFLSAFTAFVLVFERLSARLLVLVLSLGLLVAYLGNLLRMVVIGIVGYYRGIDALHWTHENAGWMIFLAWSAIFWWLILSYVSEPARGRIPSSSEAN